MFSDGAPLLRLEGICFVQMTAHCSVYLSVCLTEAVLIKISSSAV